MTKQPHPYLIKKGSPSPLGVSKREAGLNFALFSKHATGVTLSLFHNGKLLADIPLSAKEHHTGDIWHISVEGLPEQVEYGYHVNGRYLPKKGYYFNSSHLVTDPYAKSLNTSETWGDSKSWYALKGRAVLDEEFNWENSVHPKIPMQDLIIYEMHVRGFTEHGSSATKSPGTFLGIIEKIPYLKSLGINAIELMPIHEFNETENVHHNPKTQKKLFNFWGYSTVNFFAPMARYAASSEWGAAINEFKTMVKELHKNQIEVILDVVFNHTAEAGCSGPFISFRGIDNTVYYLLNPNGTFLDFTGCGNTVNCNDLHVMQMILDSLRYWVQEMHVDGFRFDLASIFCRNNVGSVMLDPPIIKALSEDPVLSKTKLIAEAWDAAGLYQVGHFPGGQRWAEWNGRYRDVARRFIKGTDGKSGFFATALCGSQDLYGHGKKPICSINFITAHDGFTLRDLVSYGHKHNLENGEHNRDGSNSNDSWNCGVEGPTSDPKTIALRERQMRNFVLALMVSIGVPMILMGDEYGHTKDGNNNTYCHDDEKNWFLWDELERSQELFHFFQSSIAFRKKNAILRRTEFLTNEEIDWHGHEPFKPNWDSKNRFVAYTLKDPTAGHSIYIVFNAHFEKTTFTLPPPPTGKSWQRIVDTSLIPSFNSSSLGSTYELPPYSAFIAQAQ
ncbi:MAG TPA: glycogen debranching protein GlgX [Rhabdochlamydiaceae bacterium]|nr:glycogen debranching protein GlgX [Rhabdochlamydiaceae bacterium]